MASRKGITDTLIKREVTAEEQSTEAFCKRLSTFITACGNFSVQYNFQSISIALLLMSASQCTSTDDKCRDGEQEEWVSSTAAASVFVGAVLGQLTMGYAGDIFGRNMAMIFTLSLVAFSALLSSVIPLGDPTQVYSTIIVVRFFLGIGVGGVYPLSAAKAAEDSGNQGGVNIYAAAFAFFWQIPGSMTPWILANIFSAAGVPASTQWRLLLGLGALPSSFVVLCTFLEMRLRNSLAEKYAYSAVDTGVPSAVATQRKYAREPVDIWALFQKWDTWKKLIAAGGGWFIYDVAYYGVSLFAGQIIKAFSTTDDDNVSSAIAIQHVTKQNLIGLSMGLPACMLSIVCLQYMNTKKLQIIGFMLIAVIFGIMAACFVPLRDHNGDALFAIYCMLLFSLVFGPNLTTYLLPAQVFPKNIRSTFHGISAALGKIGAFSGVYMFGSIAEATSYPTVMVMCALISVFGAWTSYQFIDDKDLETEPLLNDEDDEETSLVA